MRIESTTFRAPTWRPDNDEWLDFVSDHARWHEASQPEKVRAWAGRLLDGLGAHRRSARLPGGDETALSLIDDAASAAIRSARVDPADIDLVIFCGVGRGFLEPSNACFYAAHLGLEPTSCFDVSDACLSWLRTMSVVQALLAQSDGYALVINAEFHLGYHDSFEVTGPCELRDIVGALTIGEATTATVVSNAGPDWSFSFASRPAAAELCTIPLEGYEDFVGPNPRIGRRGVGKFASHGRELLAEGEAALTPLLHAADLDSTELIFTHAPVLTPFEEALRRNSLPVEKFWLDTFPQFGNTASAAIPISMVEAQRQGQLKRGMDITIAVPSAGVGAGVAELCF